MINPAFLLSGIGMMLVGVVPVLWWRYRTLVPWKDFAFGAALWAFAIGIKIAMDVTVTTQLVGWLSGAYTAAGIAIVSGAYVGLRTGLLESGLTYVAGLRTRMRKFDYEQAVALGLAFGGAEAFFIGLSSFINVAVLLAFPQIVDLLSAAQRASLLQQLSLPLVAVAAPVIERAATLAVHAFCAILVVYALKSGKAKYFMASFALKTGLDGALPLLTMAFDASTVHGMYSIEAFIVSLGALSLAGILWMKGTFARTRKRTDQRVRLAIMVALSVIIVSAAALAAAQPSAAEGLQRRTVDFDGFHGRYEFSMNGSVIGYSDFEFTGGTSYGGENAFMVRELTNLSGAAYDTVVRGEVDTTVDARPLFYNFTIAMGGYSKSVMCVFSGGQVRQWVAEGNSTREFTLPVDGDAFVIANNMVADWALLFRAARLGTSNAYVARIYSPNTESEFTRSLEVAGTENIRVKGRDYGVYVFRGSEGNTYYVTPDGVLLKVANSALEITLTDGLPEEGGMFR